MVIVYSCLREFIVLSSNTTIPPPPTVSIVLANKLGVRASKSCVRDNKSSQSLIYWLHGIYVNKKVVVATHCVDFHTGDKQSEMEAELQPRMENSLAGHTCRRCFPGSCVSRCSNSIGWWLRQQTVQMGHPDSDSTCQLLISSAAASCAFSDCCETHITKINKITTFY